MKTKTKLGQALAVFFVGMLLALSACQKSSKGASTTPGTCKIMHKMDSSWGGGGSPVVTYQEIDLLDYQYDGKGNMIEAKGSSINKFSDHTTWSNSGVSEYQYDKDGFLTGEMGQTSTKDQQNNTTTGNLNRQYTFVDRRLAKLVNSYVSNGNPSSDTTLFVYDPDGHQVEDIASGTGGNSDTRYSYSSGGLFKVSQTKNGNVDAPYTEVNSLGLFTKIIDGGIEHRMQYDAEGDLLREEEWINGNLVDATSYTYDKERNYFPLVGPGLKGFPIYSFNYLPYYSTPHNATRITRFDGNGSGNWKQTSDETYSYQYNDKGYPVSIEMKHFGADLSNPTSGRTTMIVYGDCQ